MKHYVRVESHLMLQEANRSDQGIESFVKGEKEEEESGEAFTYASVPPETI